MTDVVRRDEKFNQLMESVDDLLTDVVETEQHNPPKVVKQKSRISGAFFYITIITVLLVIFLFTQSQGEAGVPRHIAGFSAMRVLSPSMQGEIPQDSLIITRRVDPADIRVGDDITFMVNETRTFTHRVVTIFEEYAETGERGFVTQGIENPSPDREIVTPNNIVGRVVFSNLFLGQAMKFIGDNIIFIAVFGALTIGFMVAIKKVIKQSE